MSRIVGLVLAPAIKLARAVIAPIHFIPVMAWLSII
jgi:hypothetical protein